MEKFESGPWCNFKSDNLRFGGLGLKSQVGFVLTERRRCVEGEHRLIHNDEIAAGPCHWLYHNSNC